MSRLDEVKAAAPWMIGALLVVLGAVLYLGLSAEEPNQHPAIYTLL